MQAVVYAHVYLHNYHIIVLEAKGLNYQSFLYIVRSFCIGANDLQTVALLLLARSFCLKGFDAAKVQISSQHAYSHVFLSLPRHNLIFCTYVDKYIY